MLANHVLQHRLLWAEAASMQVLQYFGLRLMVRYFSNNFRGLQGTIPISFYEIVQSAA